MSRRGLNISPYSLITIAAVLISNVLAAQSDTTDLAALWADSLYNSMDRKARIGQLFMIRAHSNLGEDHIANVEREITDYGVGGLCFFQGTPTEQAKLTNRYQSLTRIPLLIAMDAEWGLGMRHKDSAMSFPRQLMLGAIQENQLIYQMGRQVGKQLKSIGVQINFAPVADINNNPYNPVIHDRSFGEDRYSVTTKTYMYAKGMQDEGVIACAKHFPGHGDTNLDSHKDLPVIKHDQLHLDSLELYPFKVLADKGIGSMMVAHIHIPALDPSPNTPATLSKPIVQGILRDRFGYNGLIITDAMEMQGVRKYFEDGEAVIRAFEAGSDIILMPPDMQVAISAMDSAVVSGRISEKRLKASVIRILKAKYKAGLNIPVMIDTLVIRSTVFSPDAFALKNKLIQASLTAVRNKGNAIPLGEVDPRTTAVINISDDAGQGFQQRMKSYLPDAEFLTYNQKTLAREARAALTDLSKMETVVLALSGLSKSKSSNFGILPPTRSFINSLNQSTKLVLVIFGTPYTLEQFQGIDNILLTYEEDPAIEDLAAQAVMGVFSLRGLLPVSAGKAFPVFSGVKTKQLFRMGYALPEEVGMNSLVLREIDSIALEMVLKKAAPGCQVLVAREGRIIYEKAFGYHQYNKERPVELSDLYDLASVTKIAASTMALMRLVDLGYIDMDDELGNYLPELEGKDKSGLVLKDVVAHKAGLFPWIPFYRFTLSQDRGHLPMSQYYQPEQDSLFSVEIARDLYLRHDYLQQMWDSLYASPLNQPGNYKYSDLGFYLIARLIRHITSMDIDRYVYSQFYHPMGLKRLLYNPLLQYDRGEVVPSEDDTYFRHQLLQGYVHDMGAAMLGGVSGHAGLFGNAHDLGVLMQMLLNNGYYGGRQYLEPETVRTFTKRVQGSTRRAMGFDMKDLNYRNRMPVSQFVSPLTYGHTGFTGTCVWNDPMHELVYVFLSNRTYPEMSNNQLNKLDIRERIQSVLYKSMESRN